MNKFLSAVTTLAIACFSAQAGEGWETNLDAALKKAATENKSIMVEFTGSDWCPPCMALAQNVFNQETFAAEAGKKYILVKLDFPRTTELPEAETAHNNAMATAHKVEGYPTIILLKSDGTEITRAVGYDGKDLAAFLAWLTEKAG